MSEKRLNVLTSAVVLTEEMDAYNSLRNKFLQLSKEAEAKVSESYDKNVKSYKDLQISAQYMLDRLFKEYLQIGAIHLISYGIYDVDEEVLREEYGKDFDITYKNTILNIVREINAIDADVAQGKADRKEMVADAGSSFQTLGFYRQTGDVGKDLSNVAKAETETMAMNAVVAGGAALLSAGLGALDKKAAESEKEDIFSRASTKNSLVRAMGKDVYQLHKTIARIVNSRVNKTFTYPSEEELEKIEPEIRNAISGNFDHDENNPDLELKQIIKILTLNPYETRVYSYIMKKHNGLTDELNNTVNYLNIDKQDLADSYLRSMYNMNEYTTYESIVPFEEQIRAEMKPFDVTECKYLSEVDDYKESLYTKRRTFNAYVYDTIDDRDKAEEQFTTFFDEPVKDMDMDDLVEKYYETLPSTVYQKNREDLQLLIMSQLTGYIDGFQDSETIDSYIVTAEGKMREYGYGTLSLLDALTKKRKKLCRKENVMKAVGSAKDSVKNFGKNLMGKVPFEKNTAIEETNEEVNTAENVKPKAAGFFDGTKKMFAGATDKVKNTVSGTSEESEFKTCPQCGATIKSKAKFCGTCGYKF